MEKDIKKENKDCPEDWVIAALTMNELDPSRSEEVIDHISSCGYCIDRAAVYYKVALNDSSSFKAPKGWMERAVETLHGKKPLREKASILKRISAFVQEIIEPLSPLPGYAVATVAVLLLIWFAFYDKAGVVTIPSQRLVFRDAGAPASFGFMGRDEVEIKDDMNISVSGDSIIFGWKEIKGARSYSFSIIDKATGKAVMAELKLKEPYATVPSGILKKRELYKWFITGDAAEEKRFEYTGEFVFAR